MCPRSPRCTPLRNGDGEAAQSSLCDTLPSGQYHVLTWYITASVADTRQYAGCCLTSVSTGWCFTLGARTTPRKCIIGLGSRACAVRIESRASRIPWNSGSWEAVGGTGKLKLRYLLIALNDLRSFLVFPVNIAFTQFDLYCIISRSSNLSSAAGPLFHPTSTSYHLLTSPCSL